MVIFSYIIMGICSLLLLMKMQMVKYKFIIKYRMLIQFSSMKNLNEIGEVEDFAETVYIPLSCKSNPFAQCMTYLLNITL